MPILVAKNTKVIPQGRRAGPGGIAAGHVSAATKVVKG